MSDAQPSALDGRKVPRAVHHVLRTLDRAGHRSWIVGGAVRDLLLRRARRDPHEFDVATPATPGEVQGLFEKVIPTGIEHGTVTVLEGRARVEVTTFRGEGAYLDGRRPSSVSFHKDLTADLARRDFTVNALAWDPIEGEFRDPFEGLRDLRRRLIRAVGDPGERFAEDGLRPLRAVRFVAELGFELERGTRGAIGPSLEVVERVSRERVAEELSRLVTGRFAEGGLRLLHETGLLTAVLPALSGLPPATVRHAVAVASDACSPLRPSQARGSADAERERCRLLRFAGLLHVLSAPVAMRSVVELRLPNRLAVGVADLVRARGCLKEGSAPFPESPVEVRRWLSAAGPAVVGDLLELLAADARHQGRDSRGLSEKVRRLGRRVRAELRRRPPLTVGDLALDGRAVMRILGVPGGPAVGEAIRHLLGLVLELPGRNEPATLESALRAWWADRPGGGPLR